MTPKEAEKLLWKGFVDGVNTCYRWLIWQDELSLAESLEKGVKGFNRTAKRGGRIKLKHVPYPPFSLD